MHPYMYSGNKDNQSSVFRNLSYIAYISYIFVQYGSLIGSPIKKSLNTKEKFGISDIKVKNSTIPTLMLDSPTI